ncbi:MAG: twin-arginine translocase TatA/TatE family subunit [Candidatus Omnitrophota bacterium]
MSNIGFSELIIILLIVLLFFGAKRLPEIGQALGKAVKEFRNASKEMGNSIKDATKDDGNEKKS